MRHDISTRLKEKFKSELLNRLHSYGERKKLRKYALFKHVRKCEPYLGIVKNRKQRIMLTKFRLSFHDLKIERGRYSRKSTKPEQRHCKICQANKTQDGGGRTSFFHDMSHVHNRKRYYVR